MGVGILFFLSLLCKLSFSSDACIYFTHLITQKVQSYQVTLILSVFSKVGNIQPMMVTLDMTQEKCQSHY
jgi:hypothetical protein